MELNFNRKALILGITLVLLVAAYALGIVFSPANVSKRLSSIPLYPVLEKAEVEEIYLEIDGDPLQLTKSSSAWTVQISSVAFPASASRIDSFLDQIAALKRSQEITSNPDLWADFELESMDAVKAAGVTIIKPDKAPFRASVASMIKEYDGTAIGDLVKRISEVE